VTLIGFKYCLVLEEHPTSPPKVKPPQIPDVKLKRILKKPSEKAKEKWTVAKFLKDAAWFAENCSLPNEGKTPHKIADVTEEMLTTCFGERGRNGYKLSNCVGIPSEVILKLTQVVDGFDKPVNGVLSHTFVKGAYAENILKRKVNWCAYAASKLKGQLQQWEREGKPRPEPPCVRKPRIYSPPCTCVEESKPGPMVKCEEAPDARPDQVEQVVALCTDIVKTEYDDSALYAPSSLLKPQRFQLNVISSTPAVPSPLLSIVQEENLKLKRRKEQVCQDVQRVDASIANLKLQERDHASENTLKEKIAAKEGDLTDLNDKIASEEELIEEMTIGIKLETNKEDAEEVCSDCSCEKSFV
jgi:hypothetical protein